jgi:diphthine synthase
MLWFIGTGIYDLSSIGNMILEILLRCDKLYIERFTSSISDDYINSIKSLFRNKEVLIANRWLIEDGRQILNEAKNSNVALISYGDSLLATTFVELRTRALKECIKVEVIHGASGIMSVVSECGLQIYRIGKMVTMMEDKQSSISVYNTLYNNLKLNSHTVILTEYRYSDDSKFFFLSPKQAIQNLLEVEKSIKYKIISKDTFTIIASRIGLSNQKIICGNAESLLDIEYGIGPHTIVIPSRLHFTELEAITTLCKVINKPKDNCENVESITSMMIKKYVPMIREEITNIRSKNKMLKNIKINELLDNAECYVDDAINFFDRGESELAILSIGYADGLVDSVRYRYQMEQ